MRIIVIGAAGTIGRAVVAELSPRHTMLTSGRNAGDLLVDMTDERSIAAMYKTAGQLDAVVITAGKVHFGELATMTKQHCEVGLRDKLMGQVNLVLIGQHYLADGGSFTLTSGIINREPIRHGAAAAMVNSALEGFVKGAAIELPRQLRINVVSPTVIAESMEAYASYFRGFAAAPAARVALAYSRSVEGAQTGQIYRVD